MGAGAVLARRHAGRQGPSLQVSVPNAELMQLWGGSLLRVLLTLQGEDCMPLIDELSLGLLVVRLSLTPWGLAGIGGILHCREGRREPW